MRPNTYTVRRGDSLYAIAWRYQLDYRDLAATNNIRDPYTIYPGDVLNLRVTEGRALSTSAAWTGEVTPGDHAPQQGAASAKPQIAASRRGAAQTQPRKPSAQVAAPATKPAPRTQAAATAPTRATASAPKANAAPAPARAGATRGWATSSRRAPPPKASAVAISDRTTCSTPAQGCIRRLGAW